MVLHPAANALLESLPPSFEMTNDLVIPLREQGLAAALAEARLDIDYVADLNANGVPARLYRPEPGAPVALYVHGGGWALNDVETYDSFCRFFANETGWGLLSVEYRRAPEHQWPEPLDDVVRAAAWLRHESHHYEVDAHWMPGIGDSSGANLIAGLCVRDPSALDYQVLIYPPVDRRAQMSEAESNQLLSAYNTEWFWEAYAPGRHGDHPEVSVLHAPNLRYHPPAYILTCEHDVLRDQGEAYMHALADSGVSVSGHRALGMIHSFWRRPSLFRGSRDSVQQIGALMHALRESPR